VTQDLKEKTALVTAASRGIGRAIAQRLAASGALVGINFATNEGAARETLKSIESQGGKGFLLQGTLGTPEVAHSIAAALQSELTKRTGSSGLDILVNNAGGVGGGGEATFVETTPEIYQRTFADNVGSTFFLTQALLSHLRTGGRVINISSAGARLALQQEFVYCMAKGAVEVFTRALAKDLGPRGITVNVVAPGLIGTEAAVDYMNNPDALNYMKSNTALGRPYGKPEEIAEVVHDLAKPGSSWVTGQIIEVSGGFRI
jgi:NAD(P)-dependent dehydrogenase (short-subunit alcohol dehydrogenase family)